MNELNKEFINPGTKYRGKPFWSWNGKLSKKELIKQVAVMKEMGFGGYFIHSRTGLETEYLGEEWFELVRACADEGQRLGLETWLYDEDRWPSGSAGGMVTKNPAYRQKFLRCEKQKELPLSFDNTVAVFAYEGHDLSIDSYRRISNVNDKKRAETEEYLVFTVEEMVSANFYNGFTYADTINKEATECFIELTHEKYKKYCGDLLGGSIKGIFTDEPQRGAVMCGFAINNRNKDWIIPWTGTLSKDFEERFNFDLVEKLPELFLFYHGEQVSYVKWAYLELLQQLFLQNFAMPIHEWCKDNKIKFTGHVLHEDSLTSQVSMQGSLMRFYEYMDVPGVDVLGEFNRELWIVKQLSSSARQTGKSELLSELYGCTGWQMGFEGHKNVGLWQALYGINFRCHHLSWYTMKGEAKRDYPASILHQSPWWKDYHYIEDYFARISVLMSDGEAVCDTLVLNPIESLWCRVYPGWANEMWVSPENKTVLELESCYRELFYQLQNAHIDFDYGDEEMLSRLYSIKEEDGQPVIYLGKVKYKQVIVGKMITIRKTTLNILEEFISIGGKVIFAGDVPQYFDCQKSDYPQQVAAKSVRTIWADTAKEAQKLGGALVNISSQHIYVATRKLSDGYAFMLLNMLTNEPVENVDIKLPNCGDAYEYDCASGEITSVESCFTTAFEKGEAKFFVVSHKAQSAKIKPVLKTVDKHNISGEFTYTLDEKNICVLDMVQYSLNNVKASSTMEIIKADRALRNKLGLPYRCGDMIQPWCSANDIKPVLGKLTLSYDFFIKQMPQGSIELVLEDANTTCVNCNGFNIDTSNTNGTWIDICFDRVTIAQEYLKIGRNTIELSVDYTSSYNLEAIYLLGDFGVILEVGRNVITSLPETLKVGDIVTQGLPFYSGRITYKMPVPQKLQNNQKLFLSFESLGGSLIKVGQQYLCWTPYELDITKEVKCDYVLVEVVLNRRNTFGPLHQKPLYTDYYAPESFITEGDTFSEDYMLVPNGILDTPVLLVKEMVINGIS